MAFFSHMREVPKHIHKFFIPDFNKMLEIICVCTNKALDKLHQKKRNSSEKKQILKGKKNRQVANSKLLLLSKDLNILLE